MSDASTFAKSRAALGSTALVSFHQLDTPELANDIVQGASGIALLLCKSNDKASIRSVYNITEKSRSLPIFRLGSRICVRKSTVRAHIWEQERRAFPTECQELLVRTHILLSAALSLVASVKSGNNAPEEAMRLAAVVAEAVPTIEQLVQAKAAR